MRRVAPAPEKSRRPAPTEREGDGTVTLGPRARRRLTRLTKRLPISFELSYDNTAFARKDAFNKRPPASVQKLLLSMALYDRLPPSTRLETIAAAPRRSGSTIPGDLWVVGSGDPSTVHRKRTRMQAPWRTDVRAVARAIRRSGITRIRGSVMGAKRPFARDWNAPGWLYYFNDLEVGLPTALTINGNVRNGRFTRRPELFFAQRLTELLERSGVSVAGAPGSGAPPAGLKQIGVVRSAPLRALVRYMDRRSDNFFAEVLGKRLGLQLFGRPGTIAKGARAIARYGARHGVTIKAYDSSGLSFSNRVSPHGVVTLLEDSRAEPWWPALHRGLPAGGQGTLEDRLHDLRVRAKTGTLSGGISALSGWLWLPNVGGWAEFSIASRGLDKTRAVEVENRVLHIAASARRS